jgi:hypothetical protein
VLGANLLVRRVDEFVYSKAGDGPKNRRARNVLVTEKAEDGVPQRIHVVAGVFVHVDRDFLSCASG